MTAHVNFTDIARAGTEAGLDLIGYLPQSYFLLNLGITDLLAQIGSPDSIEYIQAAAAVQKLIHQHEMGELFKVIAFGKTSISTGQASATATFAINYSLTTYFLFFKNNKK